MSELVAVSLHSPAIVCALDHIAPQFARTAETGQHIGGDGSRASAVPPPPGAQAFPAIGTPPSRLVGEQYADGARDGPRRFRERHVIERATRRWAAFGAAGVCAAALAGGLTAAPPEMTIVAGSGVAGFADGVGADARFNKPIRLAPADGCPKRGGDAAPLGGLLARSPTRTEPTYRLSGLVGVSLRSPAPVCALDHIGLRMRPELGSCTAYSIPEPISAPILHYAWEGFALTAQDAAGMSG